MIIEQLIHDCKNKESLAQEQIYKILSPVLFGICLKYSRNYEEAQDNLQEGFLLVFDKIDKYNFKGSFEGWVKRVIINYILQQYRSQPIFEIVTDSFTENAAVDLDDEDISLDYLTQLIQELPDRYRLVFNLYVLDDYSHKEIASMLQISVGTSKSNLSRAKTILKDKIEAFSKEVVPKTK